MAIKANPVLVSDGLVLSLDAANSRSYPGSGTTWTDLSGRGNTGTLTNGLTYSSSNGGSIVFDGVDDYVDFSTISQITNSNEITFEGFVKINGTSSGSFNWGGQYLIFKRNSRTTNFEGFSLYFDQNDNRFKVTSTPSGGSPQARASTNVTTRGIIYHVLATGKTNDSIKIYLNGVLQGTTNISHTLDLPSTPTLKIGRSAESFEGPSNATIYMARVYNRALTASEIQQNFNALRGRYGI